MHCEALVRLMLVTCGAGVCPELSVGEAVCPAPRSAGPVHGEVLPKTSGVPVSVGVGCVGLIVWCGINPPAACVVLIGV